MNDGTSLRGTNEELELKLKTKEATIAENTAYTELKKVGRECRNLCAKVVAIHAVENSFEFQTSTLALAAKMKKKMEFEEKIRIQENILNLKRETMEIEAKVTAADAMDYDALNNEYRQQFQTANLDRARQIKAKVNHDRQERIAQHNNERLIQTEIDTIDLRENNIQKAQANVFTKHLYSEKQAEEIQTRLRAARINEIRLEREADIIKQTNDMRMRNIEMQVNVDAAETVNAEAIRDELRQQITNIAEETAQLEVQQIDNEFTKQSMMRLRNLHAQLDQDNIKQVAQVIQETEKAQQMENHRDFISNAIREELQDQASREMQLMFAQKHQAQLQNQQQLDGELHKAQIE
jgi:hypothetical protein